jgi:predicted CXXCH cytochrome family protein
MKKIDVGGLSVGQLPKLTGISADLCYTCHDDLVEAFRRQNIHSPVAEGNCDACHAAHGSEHPGFVIAAAPELCGSCHELDDSLFAAHGGYDLSEADCLGCHNPHVSEQPKLVRNISHPPFAEQSCEDCHEKGPDGKVVLAAGVTDLCSACHESVTEGLEMAHVHAPFAGDDCGGCHRLHAADGENLLKAEGALLCLSCHDEVKEMQGLPVVHQPFDDGACLECHRPHASPYAALTTKPAESFCFSCHKDLEQEIAQGEPHAPVAGGECGSCHLPHAGTESALLTDSKLELCGQCHDLEARELRTAHKGFPLEGVDCQNCHAAHASPKGLLLPDMHGPFAEGDCTSCHEGLQPHQLVTSVNQLCFTCHEDFVSEGTSAFVHAPLQQDEGCVGCHGPHVGYGTSLLLKQGPQLCLGCHDSDEFRGSVKHDVAFEDCGNCHLPHTSADKGLLTTGDVMELCITCHDDAVETHYHPMGVGVTDPRTKEPLSCVGCHSAHSSDHAAILVAEKDRKLCIICHTVAG